MKNNVFSSLDTRSKEPSAIELRNLKQIMQTLQISSSYFVHYNLVSKESKSGLFDNDRLLLLNTKDKLLGYISKLPEGMIPLLNQDEVKALKFKSIVTRDLILKGQIKDFRCGSVPGKISSLEVNFKRGNRNQVEHWIMTLFDPKLMYQWINLINDTLLKEQQIPQPSYQPPLESKKVLSQYINPVQSFPPQPPKEVQEPPEDKPHKTEVPQPTVNNSKINITEISHEPEQIGSSRIANMPYYDHVTELKYLKKQSPQLFRLDNQLSAKNLHPEQRKSCDSGVQTNQGIGGSVYKRESKSRLTSSKLEEEYQQGPTYKQYQPCYPEKVSNHSQNRVKQEFQRAFEKPIASSRNQFQPITNSRQIDLVTHETKTLNIPNSSKNITIDYKPSRKDLAYQTENQEPYILKSSPINSNSFLKQYTANQTNVMESQAYSSRHTSRKGLSIKRWNQIFAENSDKMEIHEDFIHYCHNLVRNIVNQLPLDSNRQEYLPIQVKSPFSTYYSQGIIITIHQFQNQLSSSDYSSFFQNQSAFEQLKREFYNYNSVLAVTSNSGFIKVPLCAYFEYKGILALCKAQIPETFSEVTPNRYEKQFQIIENQLHIRFPFGTFNSYIHSSKQYIILDNMKELIPQLSNNQPHFFRKQFLICYNRMIEDQDSVAEAEETLIEKNVTDFLSKVEANEAYIVCSGDLSKLMHLDGISMSYLPVLLHKTKSPYLKRLILTELTSFLLACSLRAKICQALNQIRSDTYRQSTVQQMSEALRQSCHDFMNCILGASIASQQLWKAVIEHLKQTYRVILSKEDILAGYLFSSLLEKVGLEYDFKKVGFDKHQIVFFDRNNNLPLQLFQAFTLKIRRYDLDSISPTVQKVMQILRTQPSQNNFQELVLVLKLKSEQIPPYLCSNQQEILAYMCNFVPYSEHSEYQHIGIYNMILLEPHTHPSIKCSLLAIKWCVKKKLQEEAYRIFQMKEIQNMFWSGEYNPVISEFYDFYAMYYASVGHYDESIQLAKMSLKNIMTVSGSNQLPVADKHYQLGNILFKLGKKEESLREYSKTKDILVIHQQTHISQFAVILLKLSVLFLNFGKIPEAASHALEALKIFDSSQESEQDQIGAFEILARCYEITKRHDQLQNICNLAAQQFNNTQDWLIFQRMAKLVLFVKFKNLSSPQSKSLQKILGKLQGACSDTDLMQAFSFINRKCQHEPFHNKISHFLENIVFLLEEVNRTDLFRRYKSLDLNCRSEAEEMLVTFEAVGLIIGFDYMIGSLKEVYE